jgi:hypothetical protein
MAMATALVASAAGLAITHATPAPVPPPRRSAWLADLTIEELMSVSVRASVNRRAKQRRGPHRGGPR